MHSIRTKITALSLAAILVSLLAVGGIGIVFTHRQVNTSADNEARLVCDTARKTLDKYLLSVEQSVDILARCAAESLENADLSEYGVAGATGLSGSVLEDRTENQKQRLNAFLKAHCDRVEALFHAAASYTSGVVTYYYRLNPELSDSQKGFFYSRIDNSTFKRAGMVDVFDFDSSDTAHVGWYYPPVKERRPVWITPYYNQNLGMDMVSYVSPVIHEGTLVGVAGMDISRPTLTSRIQNMSAYETGYACMIDADGTIYSHPTLKLGTNIAERFPDIYAAISRMEDPNDIPLINYSYDGLRKKAACALLQNGLKLVVVAPLDEINAGWRRVLWTMAVSALVLVAVFGMLGFTALSRVTEPLRRLAEASERLSEGHYDVKLAPQGDDEVGILTRSFQHLVNHLNVYISDLNSKAYKDAMTGVKNKAAFEAVAQELNEAIKSAPQDNPPRFGIVMMDCNELKEINDAYGHDKGDLYLQSACRMICATFAHSPVFRIGGDEFVALLQNADYDNRAALVDDFERRCRAYDQATSTPWEHASIATGMAVFDPLVDQDVDSVFRRADERMYRQKKRSKEGHR